MKRIHSIEGFIPEFLNDSFFDSLRNDYEQFNEWYSKSVGDLNKSAYYWIDENNKLIAFLGLKIEKEEIKLCCKTLPIKKRLKITTIKSLNEIPLFSENVFYISFKYAKENSIDEVYFSIIPNSELEKQKLLEIAKSYNFKDLCLTEKEVAWKNNEHFLFKNINEKSQDWKESYPSLPTKENKSRDCRYFIIEAIYHDNYLQDADLYKQDQIHDFSKVSIRKAYVHNQITLLELTKGDIALIYRKSPENPHHKSVITGYGGVIKHYRKGIDYNSFEEFTKKLKNLHAFNDIDLEQWFKKNKYITIFSWIKPFGKGKNVNLKFLKENNLWPNNLYPSKRKINEEEFKKILKQGGIDV